MKALVCLSLLIAVTFASTAQNSLVRDMFDQWKMLYNKEYSTFEEEYRFNVFVDNYIKVLSHNAVDKDLKLGLTQFADLTAEEFGLLFNGYKGQESTGPYHKFDKVLDPPASVDWRTKGAVTPVKNQGSCGSCWTFSTTGALEGLYFINGSSLTSFSEQNLVDCVTADQGCDGGLMSDAFAYTAENGIDTEADYPYEGLTGKCRFKSASAYHVNKGYVNITPKSYDDLKAAVVGQPVSVAVQANQAPWQLYLGGVIKILCGDNLDHGVLVVGYETVSNTEAWIVKNSWGESWGNSGYCYISTDAKANGGNGVCGILKSASIPTN